MPEYVTEFGGSQLDQAFLIALGRINRAKNWLDTNEPNSDRLKKAISETKLALSIMQEVDK